MTRESGRGIVLLVTDEDNESEKIAKRGELLAEGWGVDLGLPSGTIWKSSNERGYWNINDAKGQFGGNRIPSKEQWMELKDKCKWTWSGSGYTVTGLNGNSIYLPAVGYLHSSGEVLEEGDYGDYVTSTYENSERYWTFQFRRDGTLRLFTSRILGFRNGVRLAY